MPDITNLFTLQSILSLYLSMAATNHTKLLQSRRYSIIPKLKCTQKMSSTDPVVGAQLGKKVGKLQCDQVLE